MASARRQLLLLVAAAACLTAGCAPDVPARPHVLFLIVDDLRPELGAYGVEAIQTPRIDQLAESGVRFTRAYAQVAVCNPSRASVLSGLRPDTAQVWNQSAHFREAVPDVVTLPQHFRRHGYHAAAIGKVFHVPDPESWDEPTQRPERAATWSRLALREGERFRARMREAGYPKRVIERMRPPALDDEELPDSQRPDGEIGDRAVETLRRLAAHDQPFFLAVGFHWPHLPFNPPRRYWDLYEPEELPLAADTGVPEDAPPLAMNENLELREYADFADVPAPGVGTLSEERERRLRHGYYASVSFVDHQVGRLLDELEQLGLRDDTIVVLWGDHGWKLGEHGGWAKQTNFEIDTRVPLIVRAPWAGANGGHSDALVELLDLYPTLSALAQLPAPGHTEGQSFAPLLDDPALAGKDAAFSQFRRRAGERGTMGYAMRTAQHRYVEWIDRASSEAVARELYDHYADPGESRNLAAQPAQRALVARLGDRLWASLPRPVPAAPNAD